MTDLDKLMKITNTSVLLTILFFMMSPDASRVSIILCYLACYITFIVFDYLFTE